MLGQIVVGSVSNSPEFAPAEGEQELNIRGALGVEAKLLGTVITQTHLRFLDSQRQQPVTAERSPVLEPIHICTGLTEELKLHLFKLSGTEGEVAGSDLISEGLTDLADTEGDLLSGGSLNILEVYKDTLCSLRAKVYGILSILGHTLEGLEHQIELSDIREIMFAAGRAGNIVLLNKLLHLLLGPGIHAF